MTGEINMAIIYDVETLDDVWGHYGGQEAFARRFSLTQSAVGNYRSRGIPSGWIAQIIFDLAVSSKTFDPALFEFEDHPGAHLINEWCRRSRSRPQPVRRDCIVTHV